MNDSVATLTLLEVEDLDETVNAWLDTMSKRYPSLEMVSINPFVKGSMVYATIHYRVKPSDDRPNESPILPGEH